MHVLGLLRDSRSTDILVALLGDPDVNYKVAWALGEIGDARATRPLIASLADPDALVRIMSIQALVKLGAKEALPDLRMMLADHVLPKAGDQITVAEVAIKAILSLEKAP